MGKLYTTLLLVFCFCYASAQKPVAYIKHQIPDSCSPVCGQFLDSSANNPTSWLWTFTGPQPSSTTAQNAGVLCWDSAGIYSVKLVVSNSFGSDSTSLPYIKVLPSPPFTIVIKSNDTLFVPYDSSYKSYQWYDNVGMPIPGATDSFYVFVGNPCTSLDGVAITNVYGCSVGVPACFGAVETYSHQSISISPNPANDQLILHSSKNIDDGVISITNVLGQVAAPVMHEQRGAEVPIDVSGLRPGIYFLRLQTKKEALIKKFIKE